MPESTAEVPEVSPPVKPPIPTGVWIVLAMAVFFGIAFGSLVIWTLFAEKPENIRRQGESGLMIVGEAPGFTLTDQQGEEFSRSALDGKIWVADFVFTRCSGPCPTMTANMRAVQKALMADDVLAARVHLVSFTVDPDWDSADRLLKYAENYGADARGWTFLTGPYDEIQRVAREGFKLGVSPADPANNEPIIHAQSLVLVDARGRIRGYFDGTNGGEVKQKLFPAIQSLVKEM